MPPWLSGLQRSSRQPARIEPRIGPSSRIACDRVGGAGGVVAAARGEGGRDEALVEADRGDQDGGEQPFHDKRSSSGPSRIRPAPRGRRERRPAPRARAGPPPPGGRRSRSRVRPPARRRAPRRPPAPPASPCSASRPCRSCGRPRGRAARHRSESSSRRGERVEDQEAVAARVALAIDAIEVAAPGEAAPARIGAALGGQRLRGEPLAALLTPAPQDRAAGAGSAPGPEPVGPGSLALLRLIGPLHQESPSGRGEGQGSIGRGLSPRNRAPPGFRRVLHGDSRGEPLVEAPGRAYDRSLAHQIRVAPAAHPRPTRGGPGSGAGSRRSPGSRGSLARDPARAGRLGSRGHLPPLVLSPLPRLPPRAPPSI